MKYRLLEKIGSGGMAEVFRAAGEGPEGFERPFVIKRIHPRLSETPEFIRMFVDEARLSARLVHPNIVQVLEFVHQDGIYYIVMEPVDGVDMGRVFRRMAQRQEGLSPLFCAEVARQVCRGLEFAHTLTRADGQPAGVVHRDVTPPNIMVDGNGTVRILDFGLARAMLDLQATSAEAGTIRGKVSYVAPELLEGQVADARSDVFSLAVVLHELLSGRRLFLGENDLETLKLVRDMPIDPPSARNPAVKAALDEIVMRGLARNPAQRYQSALEMGDDLEEFVVRRHFSTRALAAMARELFLSPGAGGDGEPEVIPPAGDAGEPPDTVGQADSVIVLEGAAERRRRPTPQPPPPPAAAVVTAQGASEPNVAPAPARSGFRLSAAGSFMLVGLSLASVLGALFVAVSARRAVTSGVLSANGPARPAGDSPGALPETVRVTLDSVPQGATVARAGVSLGETPVVLSLARGDAPVELVLTKASFTPLSFRVIANRDKDATATLEREAPPGPLVSVAAPSEETPRARRKRRAAARAEAAARAQAAAVAAPSTPVAAPAAPSPTARPAAQSPVRAAGPAPQPTRPVALVPGPGARR